MSRNVTPYQVSRKVFDKTIDLLKARIKDRADEIRKVKRQVIALDRRCSALEAIFRATYPDKPVGKRLDED